MEIYSKLESEKPDAAFYLVFLFQLDQGRQFAFMDFFQFYSYSINNTSILSKRQVNGKDWFRL